MAKNTKKDKPTKNYGNQFEWAKGLTYMQAKFAAAYMGNATEAGRAAGYRIPNISGAKTANNPLVKAAIAKLGRYREQQEAKAEDVLAKIADKRERQEFWTGVMRGAEQIDTEVYVKDRLRGSELLGKSEGDFVENINLNIRGSLATKLREAEARAKQKRADTGPKKAD